MTDANKAAFINFVNARNNPNQSGAQRSKGRRNSNLNYFDMLRSGLPAFQAEAMLNNHQSNLQLAPVPSGYLEMPVSPRNGMRKSTAMNKSKSQMGLAAADPN